MRFFRFLGVAAVLTAATGCQDLAVQNPNNPDRPRVLANPADVEALASTQFQQIISAGLGNIARAQTGMMTASFMNATGLANNGMGPRSAIPRGVIENHTGNAYQSENFNDFRLLSGVARNAADILDRMNDDDPVFTLGPGTGPQIDRLRAWTFFVAGLAYGYISLVYDSTGIARPGDPEGHIPELEGYLDVNAHALAMFDSAIAYASRPNVPALPGDGWMSGPGGQAVPMAEFIRRIRTYKAHIRADVARNPAERAAVDWAQVIADASAGIQSDMIVRMDPNVGWDYSWLATTLHFRDTNWHQMTPYIIGMADVSGAFDAWLQTPRDERLSFLIITPDQRFPQGATRADQTRPAADDDDPLPAGQYFRNRNPGKDDPAAGWRVSQYDHYRHRAWADASRIGDFPLLTRAQNDMLAAEGHIRAGNFAAAATLIDRTRVTNGGLPSAAGATMNQPVAGGADCVPRIPVGPSFTTTACGNIMEAMKWETRIETAYTNYGAWFFAGRGWGDLPAGTAEMWPVPVQELDARLKDPYTYGGFANVGQVGTAGSSTYGYGEGNR